MRKFKPVYLLLIAAFALAPFFGVQAAWAESAVVIHGGGCNLADTNGVIFFDPNGVKTMVQSDSGNSKITCTSWLPSYVAPPSKAVRWDYASTGMSCSTGFGITNDWMNVVTPSGRVTLTCHINPNPTP